MKLEVLRVSSQSDSTNGILFKVNDDGSKEFLAYTLEDEYRDNKVMHETRILAGTYKITLRTVGGFNVKYAKRFKDIHKGMLWVRNVPGFEYILIHCGNTDEHTSGCLLVGTTQTSNKSKKNKSGFIGKSTQAYFDVYPPIAEALEAGEEVSITYVDYA
jgi:hypothetical protein